MAKWLRNLPALTLLGWFALVAAARAQPDARGPVTLQPPSVTATDRPLPINLPTALHLAGVKPLDIALATEQIKIAAAQVEKAKVLWLPTLYSGGDYYRHDGQFQLDTGPVTNVNRTSMMVGAGPSLNLAMTDAIFAPLAARQDQRARESNLQSVRNDVLLAVAENYFNMQQACGELAGAEDAARRMEDVVRRTGKLAKGLVPPVEEVRARTEFARRRQAVHAARERWRIASAELARLLRLDALTLLQPLEPPHLRVTLIPADQPLDELIPLALQSRPELEGQQAVVQATIKRIRQEKLRPFIPSIVLRPTSTMYTGTLAGGFYGGGVNGSLSNFGPRGDFDLQILWELQNLGLGNRAKVHERRAENQLAMIELFRLQDRIAAEVARAHAQVQSAQDRMADAELGVQDAVESANKNLEGLSQTLPGGAKMLTLVIRPQEVVASVQALAQAYNDFYGAVADYDRAQFRLYRALGQPAQKLTCQVPPPIEPSENGVELLPPQPIESPPTR